MLFKDAIVFQATLSHRSPPPPGAAARTPVILTLFLGDIARVAAGSALSAGGECTLARKATARHARQRREGPSEEARGRGT